MADEVEERGGRQAGSLPDHRAVAPATACAPILQRGVVGPADGALDEAVAFDPARLLRAPKHRPDLRAEPVEQVEERGGVAAHQGAREAEGRAAGVGEDPGGDALRGASALVFVHLVADEQVEAALHAVLHVVG